jgi:hypothetical protein
VDFPLQGLFPEEYRPLEQSLFICRRTIQAHRHNDIRKQILQVIYLFGWLTQERITSQISIITITMFGKTVMI